jgi:hypothetical protein
MTREEFIGWCEERFALTKNDIYDLGQLYDEVTKPHWISVKDRKPKLKHSDDITKYSDTVIVTNGKYRTSARWLYSTWGGWYGWYDGDEELKGVTHWMSMPEAPTVAKNATVNEKGGEL